MKYISFIALIVLLLTGAVFLMRQPEGPDSVVPQAVVDAKPTTSQVGAEPAPQKATARERTFQADLSADELASAARLANSLPEPVSEVAIIREEQGRPLTEGYGSIPAVDLSDKAMNDHKASVIEAVHDPKKFPERLSVMGKGKPFDANAWQKSKAYRKAYLSVVEPGRAFKAAQPAADVPRIARASAKFVEILQNEETILGVSNLPSGAPATFTSHDAAIFENGLSSITVQADTSGHASAALTATSGVISDCRVTCASPLASATISYIINVSLPPKEN